MEERQSRWSSMVWKRLRPYSCARLIPQNSMFSNFCHVLKGFLQYTTLNQSHCLCGATRGTQPAVNLKTSLMQYDSNAGR